ncbi:hypothetical protein L6164_019326 [Bauhinia variegata]|uniref:Uncharacterized protein n=1 Tax=Bauhinia variegata TaxID=167791 RepID=A0ACB9MSZ6_BAUVA|nr:hypothetical protein L6164_019326 [Bauhinia variegata]
MDSPSPHTLRNTLETLSCANGWSYAIFWRFDPRNSLLLTAADAYYNREQMEMDNMLAQVHVLGEGIVGQAAFAGNHRWIISDERNLAGMIASQDLRDDDSELRQHFFSGIKTIAMVSVKPWGVVQFGSKHKILERLDFLEQTQRIFSEMEDVGLLDPSDSVASPLDCENYDLNELLSSFISSENSCDWNLNSFHDDGDGSGELIRNAYSWANVDHFFPPISKNREEGMAPVHGDFSCFNDQLTAVSDAQIALSCWTNTNDFLKTNSSMDSVVATNACLGTLNGEVSPLSILELQLVPETRTQDVVDMCANTFDSNKLTVENPSEDSALTSLYGKNGLLEQRGTFEDKIGKSMNDQHSPQSTIATEDNVTETLSQLHGFSNNLKPVDIWEDLSQFCSMDDLCQWFDPSPEDSTCGTVTALDNTLSQTIEFNPTYSSPVGRDVLSGVPVNSEGQHTFASMHISDSTKLDFNCVLAGDRWGNILTPVVNATTDCGLSEFISELNNIGRLTRTRKGLFSELGIEDLLNGAANSNSLYRSNLEDRLSTNKRQRTDYSPAAVTCSGVKANSMQPVSNYRFVDKQETFPKSQVGLRTDDNHSVNNGKAVLPSQPEKPEELTKTTRKSSKTSRPQPKDRQQIQDSIKELRGIIPHGGKCSIDSLLDRTIKYMLFLQSIAKYADKLQEGNGSKLIEEGNGNGVVLKDKIVGDSKSGGGSTWALEVGGQTMVCPIIVEDMSSPGQMLIEMLCEGQGFFLEIADIIRRFGLNILKGKMEIREGKIWARFIVEAKRHVTRVDVFWFLIQLVQQTNSSGMDSDSANKPSNGPENRDATCIAMVMTVD